MQFLSCFCRQLHWFVIIHFQLSSNKSPVTIKCYWPDGKLENHIDSRYWPQTTPWGYFYPISLQDQPILQLIKSASVQILYRSLTNRSCLAWKICKVKSFLTFLHLCIGFTKLIAINLLWTKDLIYQIMRRMNWSDWNHTSCLHSIFVTDLLRTLLSC